MTVRVPNWLVEDGEFGPVAVGEVVHVGLAWLAIDGVESVRDDLEDELAFTADGHARCVGRWEHPDVPDVQASLAVVRSGPFVLPVLSGVASVEGPVEVRGTLGVEVLVWDARGYLWPRYPHGVRPWRLVAARTLPDLLPQPGVPELEHMGEDEFVVDLEAVGKV